MKVFISVKAIYPFHSFGGVEKYIYNMAKYLVLKGIDVEIIAPLYKKNIKHEYYNGINFTFLSTEISYLSNSSLGRIGEHIFGIALSHYLDGNKFDLLHGVELTPYIYLHKKDKKPVLFHLFYDTYKKKPHADILYYIKYPFIKLLKTNAVKYCLKNATTIMTETTKQSDELIKLFNADKDKISNLPVAVDIKKINELANNNTVTRGKIGLKPDDFVLTSVNRLVREKGIGYLIDALRIIKNKLIKAKLLLIGTGYQERGILSRINNYKLADSVIHLKNVKEEELYGYYSISDLYVSPTLQEDFIMGIQEAMACGLPVVSTGQDWLVQDGINGYLVERKNPEMLAQKIVEIYHNKTCKQMGEKSKEIIKKYDWSVVINKLIQIYENTLRNKH